MRFFQSTVGGQVSCCTATIHNRNPASAQELIASYSVLKIGRVTLADGEFKEDDSDWAYPKSPKPLSAPANFTWIREGSYRGTAHGSIPPFKGG